MKNFKRILSYLMIVVIGVFLFSGIKVTNVLADETFKFKTDKGYFKYSINDNKITIKDYDGTDTKLEIPSKIDGKSVTSIGERAFMGSCLTNINIPNTVTSIGTAAFVRCSSLKSINIPNSVTKIGSSAFLSCSSLTSINIPSTVTRIENFTFSFCSSLTSINIPNMVTSIGDHVFEYCESLKSINIPSSVTRIEEGAFWECKNLKSINVPSSVTSIAYDAFEGCDNLVIYGEKGSRVESYAKAYKIPFRSIDYPIEDIKPLVIESFTSDKQSPQKVGTIIKLTTKTSGGDGSVQYKYYRYLNEKYAVIKEWSTENNVTIAPKNLGVYDICVAVKDFRGNIVRKKLRFEIFKNLNKLFKIESFTSDKQSPQKVGTIIKLTTKISGDNEAIQYKYYRYLNGKYALIKDWNTSNTITVSPKTIGTYDIYVGVKDIEGNIVRKNIKFTFN